MTTFIHPDQPNHRLVVCGECSRTAARCRLCQLPIRPERATDGLCSVCAQHTLVCKSCGARIIDRYVQINDQGPYCQACFELRQRCDVCGVPLDSRAQSLPDGRAICSTCQQTAVVSAGQAKAIFDRTLQIIQTSIGIYLHHGVRFVVTDRPGLRAQVAKARHDVLAYADDVRGIYVREGPQRTIYVQNGLPRILMVQVIAHEWAHAWQMETCPHVRDPLEIEGFAEWVAYKVLQAMGAVKKMALMTARTDLYGQALNRMLARETRAGIRGVLSFPGSCA